MIADAWLERLGRRGAVRGRRRPVRERRPPTRQRRSAGVATRFRGRVIRRPSPKLLIAFVAVLLVLFGAWSWFRQSSFVSVQRVTVTGQTGPDAGRIRRALVLAARNMTTLDVDKEALSTAVAPFPVVKGLRVNTQFPHGMQIQVVEEVPVAEVSLGHRMVAVASDGMLVHDAAAVGRLPTISLSSVPGGPRIADRSTLEVVAMLDAAPYQLLGHLSQASLTRAHGLVAQLRNGPAIYFGSPSDLAAKWSAAAAVLADSGSAGAQYIDVSDPQRPVAGATGASPGVSGASPGASGASTSGSATTATTTEAGTAAPATDTSGTSGVSAPEGAPTGTSP